MTEPTRPSSWLGRECRGRGVAAALRLSLAEVTVRPLYARVVKANVASLRVLERCGTRYGENEGSANARGREAEESMLIVKAEAKRPPERELGR